MEWDSGWFVVYMINKDTLEKHIYQEPDDDDDDDD